MATLRQSGYRRGVSAVIVVAIRGPSERMNTLIRGLFQVYPFVGCALAMVIMACVRAQAS